MYSHFADLPACDADAEYVRNQILEMGFRSADIQVYENSDKRNFMTMMKDLNTELITTWTASREKTFVFVYYVGHGIIRGFTQALCNGDENGKEINFSAPLEKLLRILGTNPGAYVLGISDCGRDNIFDET